MCSDQCGRHVPACLGDGYTKVARGFDICHLSFEFRDLPAPAIVDSARRLRAVGVAAVCRRVTWSSPR